MGLPDREAVHLYRKAIDLGVTYIDTAPGYENAQSQLAKVLPGLRDDVFLVTKVPASDGKAMRQGIENNLSVLQTDYADLVLIHSIGGKDIDEVLSSGGALPELVKTKERGLARYIGFSAHNRPADALQVLDSSSDIDVVMLAMNFVERHVYHFEDQVLPIARANGIGVAAMKVFGGAPDMEYHSPVRSAMEAKGDFDLSLAFRYALGLPGVAVAVIGVYTEEELERNVRWAREFVPLSPEEERTLFLSGSQAAGEWGERYGPAR